MFQVLLPKWLEFRTSAGDFECAASDEFRRLHFNEEYWRISDANSEYRFVDFFWCTY